MARHRDRLPIRVRVAAAVGATAMVVTGTVAINGVALAAPSALPGPAATAEQWEHAAELKEFRTSDNAGTFYTLSEDEARKAESVHKFEPTGETAGIRMFTTGVPGTIAAHRLKREGVSYHTYIVSSNKEEIEALTSGRTPGLKFEDQGKLGYVFAEQRAGTMPLFRYEKGREWRVARDNRADLLLAGFTKSKGPIGFVPNG